MSTTQPISKKRKRDSVTSEHVSVKLATATTGAISPLLVSYPALQPPLSTAFQCYRPKRHKIADKKDRDQQEKEGPVREHALLVVGETNDIEFVSSETETKRAANSGCRYVLAIRDRRTSTLSVLPVAKSPHILTRTVKALKSAASSAAPTHLQFKEARNALGETFGTKKAKANIRAQERNRVDVSAMEGVMDFVMQGIDKGAAGLLTAEEAKAEADSNRLVPPFDDQTSDPGRVYPLHGIIPENEWRALSISQFEEAEDAKSKVALLHYKRSSWINGHLRSKKEESTQTRDDNLKILLYISYMLAFRQHTKSGVTKQEATDKLDGIPAIILHGLLSRFTEVARDSTKHKPTSASQTSFFTYMFALCLKVDNYATDTNILAQDLSMPLSRVNQLFKSLGCKVTLLGERERTRLRIPQSQADVKRAVLSAPVQFPNIRKKRIQ